MNKKAPAVQQPINDPLSMGRIDGFINDVTRSGEALVQGVSQKVNEITLRRAIQIGYMMACQDHGLPVPDMADPGEEFMKVLNG